VFSVDALNERLRYAVIGYSGADAGGLAEGVQAMLRRLPPGDRPVLEELLARANPMRPALVDVDVAARMVRPYACLLRRVGADGIKLTSGEHHTWPVLEFR
jgi:hypothetical protein